MFCLSILFYIGWKEGLKGKNIFYVYFHIIYMLLWLYSLRLA